MICFQCLFKWPYFSNFSRLGWFPIGEFLSEESFTQVGCQLQRVLNAAARVISGTRKFDRGLSRIIRDDLHWLNAPQRVTFKVCMTVYKCLHGLAPPYLAELCVPVADVGARHRLRSVSRGLLDSPRFNMSNYGRRAFSFAGPRAWNSLPEYLRQASSLSVFKRCLKTYLFK